MAFYPIRLSVVLCRMLFRRIPLLVLPALLIACSCCAAQDKAAPSAGPDVLVLANGDTLHGKFVNEIENNSWRWSENPRVRRTRATDSARYPRFRAENGIRRRATR